MRKLFRGQKKKDATNSGQAAESAPQSLATQKPTDNPSSPDKPGEPFRSQGDDLVLQSDYNGAIVMYNAALRCAPNDVGILLSRSVAHSMSTPPKLDLALKDADTVIRLKPDWWHGWLQKGEVLSQMDDLENAEEALTNAVGFAKGVDKSLAHRTLANVQARQARSPSSTSPTESELPRQSQSPSTPQSPLSTRPNLQVIPPQPPSSASAELQPSPSTPHTGTSPLSPSSTIPSPVSPWQTAATANSPTLSGPAITSRLSQGSASAQSATARNQVNRFSWAQSVPLGSGTTAARESMVSTSSVASSTQMPAPTSSTRSTGQNTTSTGPRRPNPINRTAQGADSTFTQAFNDLIDLSDNIPTDAPPAYTPNLRDPAQLRRQLDELDASLREKNKGALTISPYTLPGSIDAIRLLYIGLTTLDLTAREYGTPTYLHPNFRMMAVETSKYPGNTFLDMDCESSAYYDGKVPGTTTVSGYSEEYRAQQLLKYPLIEVALEGDSVLPDISLSKVITRLRFREVERAIEDNVGLVDLLGLSQLNALQWGFRGVESRQKQISYLCMALTRSMYDAPSRFMDCSKARSFSSNTMCARNQGIGFKNFLFQILIGEELLIRLRKAAITVSYGGLVTDAISALMVLAALWMENVVIQGPKPGQDKEDPLAYSLWASQNQRQGEALIRFGEAMEWPYMSEARNFIENVYQDLVAGRPASSWDIYDWIYGLVLPGKIHRHRIMCCLVHSTPAMSSINSAPYWENGIIVKDKSYWPRRTVLGRVLGGMKGVKSVCGWIGPVPAPEENISGWVRLKARNIDIPVPVSVSTSSQTALQDFGFDELSGTAVSAEAILHSIINPDEWVQVSPPTAARQSNASSVQLKAIHLVKLPVSVAASTTISTLPPEEYRASLDFEINGQIVSYTLYSNPLFIAAPPCVNGPHVLHQRQAQKYKENVVLATRLGGNYSAADQLLVVDATGEGEEVLARAWCAERGRHAVVRRGEECCFSCAASVAVGRTGLGINVLILSR